MSDAPARGVDPRGPRFAAAITSVLLLIDVLLGLTGLSTARAGADWFEYAPLADATFVPGAEWAISYASLPQRALDAAFVLLLVIALLFLWGVLGPRTAPWGVLYRKAVQPRLSPLASPSPTGAACRMSGERSRTSSRSAATRATSRSGCTRTVSQARSSSRWPRRGQLSAVSWTRWRP